MFKSDASLLNYVCININILAYVAAEAGMRKFNSYCFRINLPLFSTVVPAIIFMFLSCMPFVVITTLSTGLVGVEVTSVSWLGQLTVGV